MTEVSPKSNPGRRAERTEGTNLPLTRKTAVTQVGGTTTSYEEETGIDPGANTRIECEQAVYTDTKRGICIEKAAGFGTEKTEKPHSVTSAWLALESGICTEGIDPGAYSRIEYKQTSCIDIKGGICTEGSYTCAEGICTGATRGNGTESGDLTKV